MSSIVVHFRRICNRCTSFVVIDNIHVCKLTNSLIHCNANAHSAERETSASARTRSMAGLFSYRKPDRGHHYFGRKIRHANFIANSTTSGAAVNADDDATAAKIARAPLNVRRAAIYSLSARPHHKRATMPRIDADGVPPIL